MASSTQGLSQSTVINAPPEQIMEALLDFESYPDWMEGVEEIEVRKRDKKKRGTEVRYKVDAVLIHLSYVLKYEYKDNEIVISYLEGDLDDVNSSYVLESLDDERTEVTYNFDISYSLPKTLRNPVVKRMLKTVDKRVMKSALSDLKKKVESD